MKVQEFAALLAIVPLCMPPALAQTVTTPPTAPSVAVPAAVGDGTASLSPFGAPTVTNADAAAVTMPKLTFAADGTEAANFDKYYVFHRADTDFATAYADIAECDGYARGLQSGISYTQAPYPYTYTMAGAVGGMLGNALAMAIFGSAEKRRLRRVNMRTCMHYKGYSRHGLPKALWDDFNFEEGIGHVSDDKRHTYLMQQALVASSGQLQGEDLGL